MNNVEPSVQLVAFLPYKTAFLLRCFSVSVLLLDELCSDQEVLVSSRVHFKGFATVPRSTKESASTPVVRSTCISQARSMPTPAIDSSDESCSPAV